MKYTFLDEHGLQTAWEIIKLYFRSLSQTLTKNNIIDLKNIDNSNSNSGGLISLELSDKLASIEEGALVNYLIKVNNTPTPATEEGIVNIVIPTSISAFDNDSEYLTEDDVVELISDLLEGPTLLSDWAETDDLLITFIKNKPEIPSKVSDLLNDSNFVSKDYVDSADTTLTARIRAEEDFRMAADNNLVAADNALSGRISDIEEILPSGGSSTNTLTTMNWVRNKINAAVEPKADKSEAIGSLSLAINSTNFLITLSGTKVDGTSFTVQDVIDLPLESVVVSGSYDDTTKKVILTLQNGSVIDFSVADLVAGLQSEINSSNKLPSDLVDDTNCLNKFVTTLEKSQWNNKYDKPSGGIPKTDLENSVQTSLGKADTALQEEVDPIFSSSPASEITSLDIVNWNSKYDKPSNGIPETDLALSVQDSLEAADTAYLKPSSGIPSTDMSLAVLDSLDLADSAYLKPNTGIPKSDLAQGVLDSLNLADTAIQTETDPTVPSHVKNISLTNITNWNNKYTKPSGGIPASDMTTAVQTSLGKADTAYQKPSSGIPSTDLSAGVLSSLNKADTALLSETDPIFSASPAAGITSNDITNWNNKYTKPSGGIPSTDMTQAVLNSLAAADTAVQPGDLANVATSGDYDDLLNKPDLSVYAESSDLATVATSGSYNDLTNKPDLSVYAETNDLATVATTGSYEDLLNKPTIPTIPNLSKGTTTGNGNAVTDISVSGHTITLTKGTTFLTEHLDISGKANKTDAIGSLTLSMDSSTYVITLSGTKADGTTAITSLTIDLPLETVVVGGSYNSSTKKVILTLKNNLTVEFSVADLIDGLQSTIDSSHKLSADLVDDSNTTNKFVTALDKTNWNKQADWNLTTTSAIDFIKNKPDLSIYALSSNLATVATSGSYNDLSNTPNLSLGTTIGNGNAITNISVSGHEITLTKGSTFLTEAPVTSVNSMTGDVVLDADDVKAVHDYSKDYLTFTALESGTFTFTYTLNNIQYSIDNGATWTSLPPDTASPTINAGSKIIWKATNLTATSSDGIGGFSATGNFNVCGNVMSLQFGDSFEGQVDLTGKDYAFLGLFYNNTKLIDAANLILPATTLSSGCYRAMFSTCSSLVTPPKLIATVLEEACYRNMFAKCTSLTKAPELPAITLANYCYLNMFNECTSLIIPPELPARYANPGCYYYMFLKCSSLITAPELPATVVGRDSYNSMFYLCTSLKEAPELPATTLANVCYAAMFESCSSLIKAPTILPATTLASSCYLNMFRSCTSLTKAPELPATTLANYCYQNMFSGCTNLNYIKCLATNISATSCTSNWVSNVASSGTFVKDATMSSWTTGASGIPTGWNTYTENEWKEVKKYELDAAINNITYPVTSVNGQTGAVTIDSNVLVVTFNMTGDTITCDTTIDEIFNAIESGKYVYGILAESIILTPNLFSDYILFSTTVNDSENSVLLVSVGGVKENNTDTWQFINEGGFVSLMNTIESITVNGVGQPITNKNVDITAVTSINNKSGDIMLNSDDVKAVCDYGKEYLTFTALQDATFTFTTNTLQYSLNNGATWKILAADTASPTVTAGNKILWKQTGLTPSTTSPNYGIGTFSATGNFNVSGNIMSLYYGDNFIGQTDLTGKSHAFNSLFYHNTKLINSLNLVLPATTLSDNCYRSMFNGCTSLKTTPEVLPATSSTEYCYKSMFYGCTSLVTAPKTLPATTLAEGCYQYMFYNCILLTTAPELPATTLADSCYQYMLQKCASLNYIKCLATNISIRLCVNYWVKNVSSSGTFIRADSMTSWPSGQHGIPTGWNAYSESEWKEVKHYELADVAISGSYNDLTNRPTIPTVPTNVSSFTNDANYATTSDVSTAVSNLVNLAPSTLDTLNELATALGNDPNFATTVATLIGGKVSKVSSTDNAIVRFDGTTGNIQNSGVTIDDSNNITAASFKKSGGTASLFLKADGSVDSNTYATTLNVTTSQNEILSRGENLVINGNCFMMNNTNYSNGTTFDGSVAYNSPGSFKVVGNKSIYPLYNFPINPNETYKFSFDAKSSTGGRLYAYVSMYDIDGNNIADWHLNIIESSKTYLTLDLNPGDTILHALDLSGWTLNLTDGAGTQYVVFWNYTNSFGYTYPEFTYSRTRAKYKYPSSTYVNTANNTIELNSAWTGNIIPAGTAISRSLTGGYKYFVSGVILTSEWQTFNGTIGVGGIKLCPATAKANISFLVNYNGTSSDITWLTNISATSLASRLELNNKANKNNTTAGTYKSVTVNNQGIVTAGTNPTTLAGYGITDAINTGTILKTTDSGYEGGWEHAGDNAIPTVAVVRNKLIQKSSTSGLVKNDGTIDTNTYLTSISAGDNVVVSGNEVGVPTFPVNKIVPMYEKTYENYTCGNASTNDLYIFFGNVVATSNRFQDPWEIYYTLKVSTSTDACLGEYDVRISCTGTTIVYSVYNRFYSSSYYPIYLHYFLYHDNATKYGNRETYPFKIGARVYSAYSPTTVARTYTIKVWETRGCTVTFPTNIETYTNIYNSSNYGSTSVNAYSTGLQETGDSTDSTTMQLYYSYLKVGTNGIKLYSLIMLDSDGNWQSLTTGTGGTLTTKLKNPIGFRINSKVYWINRSTDIAVNNTLGAGLVRAFSALIDLRYSLNINTTANGMPGNLLPRLPVYIVGHLGNDGLFYLEDTWWTQYEPTTEDGKLYIKIAESVYPDYENARCYRVDLIYNGGTHWFKDGAFRRFYGKESLNSYSISDLEFVYRQTSDGITLYNGNKAAINNIKGNTLAWNQMCNHTTNPFIPYTSSNVSVSKTDLQYDATVLDFTKTGYNIGIRSTYTLKHVSGHKYCLHAEIKSSVSGNFACEISNVSSGVVAVTSSWTRCAFFVTAGSSVDKNVIVKPQGIYYTQENNTYSVKDINIFDLTLIYGEGNEPSTPEQFEADYLRWFGKPLIYEPYDEGSLRNVQMEGIKSVGFNQWDEEWELGRYTNGEKSAASAHIRCVSKIKVLPNKDYYIKSIPSLFIQAYDSDGNYLAEISGSNGTKNTIITTAYNVHYITFWAFNTTTYNNDICINISDTNKNGTYEPYEEHNISVPVTTLTGKVNGQGESVVVFPDGMKGVNDVKDEIKVENGVTKAIKRRKIYNLGDCSWTKATIAQKAAFYTNTITDSKKHGNNILGSSICSKYTQLPSFIISYVENKDKIFVFNSEQHVENRLIIFDSSYENTDAATFKTAMSGVYLDYELEEPVEYVVDDFDLPVSYTVSKEGTEEIIPVTNEITVAPTLDITYGVNISDIKGLPKVSSNDNGKTLQVVNGLWALVSVPTIYTGTGVPSDLDGNDGDIYIQTF